MAKIRISKFGFRKVCEETDTITAFVLFKGHNVGIARVNGKWWFANDTLPELTAAEQEYCAQMNFEAEQCDTK